MYRTPPPKHHEPTARAVDRSTDTIIEIENGIISRIAYPCYYIYRKDGKPYKHPVIPPIWHDHLGWPSPDKRDRSFQPRLKNLIVEPIHLSDEGYTDVIVALRDEPDGLTITGEIDDSIVRLTIKALCEDAISERVDVKFAVYLEGTLLSNTPARDLVTRGILRIVPAIYAIEAGPGLTTD